MAWYRRLADGVIDDPVSSSGTSTMRVHRASRLNGSQLVFALRALLALSSLAVIFASNGCTQEKSSSAVPAASSVAQATSLASPAPAPPAPAPITAPFTVSLTGPPKIPKGTVELTLDIEAHQAFGGKTTIRVELPEGVKVVGTANLGETLDGLVAGKTTRSYKLAPASKIDPNHPVKISVEGADPAGRFGARADRTYPEKPTG